MAEAVSAMIRTSRSLGSCRIAGAGREVSVPAAVGEQARKATHLEKSDNHQVQAFDPIELVLVSL